MRIVIKTFLLLLLLTACGQEIVTPSNESTQLVEVEQVLPIAISETERLNQWLDERFEEELSRSPITLTRLGRKDKYDQIDDGSEAAAIELLAWREESVEALSANFSYDALSQEAKISYDLWVYKYEAARDMAAFRRHSYIFDQMRGEHASLPTFLINSHNVEEAFDMESYISRIAGISRRLDQLLVRAQLAAEEGIRPPLFSYEIVMVQSQALISGAPFDSESEVDAPLWADAKTKIETLVETGEINESKADEFLAQAEQVLLESFKPTYDALLAWLESDLENADQEARGVSELIDGEAFYNARLANMTTTNLSADEIHALGLEEVARIKLEMEAIKRQVGFGGTMQDFFSFIKTDNRFFYSNDDEGRQSYLDDSSALIDAMRNKLPDYFGLLPKADLVVRRVEAFREQDGAAAHYRNGSPDGSRPGIYYSHLSDMTSVTADRMEAVAYHEGIPGHHMQISIQQELIGVPEFQKLPGFTSYIEGWALYAEFLAKEMGGYEDPYKDFGRLTSEIFRAIRLVVDTGIHAKGWSEEEAVAYALENSTTAEGKIRAEIQRYFVMPGQATSYKIGMLKFLELREKAQNELGDQFDIRAFHDVILGSGALPLSILERVVDNWIAKAKM